MNILAIETSCDETAVAVLRDGRHILSNVVASQIGLHARYGGVVPELASRQHIITLVPTLEEALKLAGLAWDGIDAVAVTRGPGLAGALLVGLNAAKAIAFARGKPLVAVNHLEAHIYSNWIVPAGLDMGRAASPAAQPSRADAALRALGVEPEHRDTADLPSPAGGTPLTSVIQNSKPWAGSLKPQNSSAAVPRPDIARTEPTDPAFPLLCLVVSGGHTELVYMRDHGAYSILGKTVDDAAGEAFDKVARILGLPYPGGPSIQQAAEHGNARAVDLPRAAMRGSYDFSFSGLKTAALRQAQRYGPPTPSVVSGQWSVVSDQSVEVSASAEAGRGSGAAVEGQEPGAAVGGQEQAVGREEQGVSDPRVVGREPGPGASGQESQAPGLIRVKPEAGETPAVQPDETSDTPAVRADEADEADDTPRILGRSEQEEVAPPPFLAERGGGTPPTQMRRKPAPTPAEPDAPAFLRERGQAGGGPRQMGSEQPPVPPPPAQSTDQVLVSGLERAGSEQPPAPRPPAPAARPPAPVVQAPAPVRQQPTPLAQPPAPIVRPPTPVPQHATPIVREVRAVPKSAQVGRASQGDDEAEVDAALDALLDTDEDLGTGDQPSPPSHPGRSLGLDGPRRPEARMPAQPAKPLRGEGKPPLPVADFAASFQEAAVEILVEKTVAAAAAYKVRTVLLAGGVAANLRLRERLRERLGPDITLRFPPPSLCTDNAAMVSAAAYFRYDAGLQEGWALDIDPNASYV